jgi:gliding motility-associated-like protein
MAFLLLFTILQQNSWAQLHAKFGASPASGCAPIYISFTDSSTGNPNSWKWDLGNGTISYLQNPSTTYFNPGKYNIKLVVRTATGIDSVIKQNYIVVYALPKPQFKASDTTGCFPLTVHFSDQSIAQEGNIVKWEWDLGDGTISNLQNPVHVYTAAGNYNVILKTTNSAGCVSTLSKPQYIKINNGVKAGFSFINNSICKLPSTINFINSSTGTGTLSYQWSFGDGNSSSLQNPVNTYSKAGLYTVQLIVNNNTGCTDTLTKKDSIVVGLSKAGFASPDTACQNMPFQINNTTQPTPISVLWNFGDGSNSNALNPAKAYNIPGKYTITLMADFGGCKDTVTKPVTIIAKPIINFNANQTVACKAPFAVQFTNTSSGILTYNWNFGDGSSSTQANPLHTYLQNGVYTVTLTGTNSNSCTDSLVQTNYITVQAPSISITSLPAMGCAPLSFKPLYTVNSPIPISSYLWDFGDGSTSNLANPVHVYAAPGLYTVTISYTTSTGCTGSISYPNAVHAGQKPTANFSVTPTDACAVTPIQFTDKSTGKITNWYWQFGDGNTDTTQNPIHLYGDTGYFNIQLIAINNGCADTLLLPKVVHIKPPVAQFTASRNCLNPFHFTFTDKSAGANAWSWDFGDGSSSTIASPVHDYANTGTYYVTLTVTNGTCTHTASFNALVINEKSNFIASDTVLCRGGALTFQPTGLNTGNIISYQWNFGDGSSSTLENPVITYTKSGVYSVRLIITSITGCSDTLTKTNYITVNGPTANYGVIKANVCLNTGGNVQFSDSSKTDGVHGIKNWAWNFGDGNSQIFTGPAFNHAYLSAGFYTTTLKITDSLGCSDSISKINQVYIANPKADFSSPDTMSCRNKPIGFINQSTGVANTYNWNFGDGNNSGIMQPVHNYLSIGNYDIRLTVVDAFGCRDSLFKPKYINIEDPKALFTVSDSFGTCPPLVVNYTNKSKYYNQLSWDFGDGTGAQIPNPVHYYNYPGVYIAYLVVTSPGGCTDTIRQRIEIKGPTGSFKYDKTVSCNPGNVEFVANTQNTQSYIWDYNDGNTENTTDASTSHSYLSMGIYVPRIILQDALGCKVPILGKDTIRIFGVSAQFKNDKSVLCDSGMVSFTDASLSNDYITSYQWLMGDGTLSTDNNSDHFYNAPGNYPVRLVVTTQNGCRDTSAQSTNIRVVGSPQIAIRSDSSFCVPATVNLFGDISVADTSAFIWKWDLGNSNTSSLQNPASIVYQNASNYTVTVSAANSSGCITTRTKQIVVHPLPNLKTGGNTVICEQKTATLQATGADVYTWSPATAISCTNCATPVVSPLTNTMYYVNGESIFGCKAIDSVIIRVKHPFTMRVGNGDTLCKGASYRLMASNAELYDWSPSVGLDNTHGNTVLARPLESTDYRVIGYDSIGCYYDTAFFHMTVYPIPTVDLGGDKTIAVGSSVELKANISADATYIQWQPSLGLSCGNCPNPVANPKQTTVYNLTAMNQGGCINKAAMTVFVVCNNGNVFLPNTFSPNGDGVNDIFYPRGTGLYSIRQMRIFNRWGEPVFESNNFQANDASKGWNGLYKNKPAPNDVYVYFVEVICENNSLLTYSGNITLIR